MPVPLAPRALHAAGSSAERHSVEQLAARITGAAVEVLAGQRPVAQLAPWLPRDLLARLQLRANLGRMDSAPTPSRSARAHRASTVTSARATLVSPGVYEASAVVSDRLRSRAVALRLENVRGSGWRVTALEIG
ncbi:hypothetical protein LK10_19205 [Sinomonas humi]|uniref:Uncharacterized protein n=1 Tax=Sinomonas humi TaxID=1338436 RepID=A0A0B2AFJ9_9MICC|nr:hypothetical protein LK10_19205 [Sinomonas humi]